MGLWQHWLGGGCPIHPTTGCSGACSLVAGLCPANPATARFPAGTGQVYWEGWCLHRSRSPTSDAQVVRTANRSFPGLGQRVLDEPFCVDTVGRSLSWAAGYPHTAAGSRGRQRVWGCWNQRSGPCWVLVVSRCVPQQAQGCPPPVGVPCSSNVLGDVLSGALFRNASPELEMRLQS